MQCVEKKSSQNDPPILRVKISSRVGHRRKSYERTKRQGGGRSGKLGGISQNFWIFSSSTFGVKIDHAKMMINAEEEISNKNFWVLSARARARARRLPQGVGAYGTCPQRGLKMFSKGARQFLIFEFSPRAHAFWDLFVFIIFLSSPLLKHTKKILPILTPLPFCCFIWARMHAKFIVIL